MTRTAKDEALHLYNGRDVYTQMVSAHGLKKNLSRDGTWAQQRVDTQLLPIVREMSHLGVVIDLTKRGEYSKELHRRVDKLRAKLQHMTGRPEFNPGSFVQVRDWLYSERGHTPILNTDQKDWKEDDDPSTSMGALTALSDVLRQGTRGRPPGLDERFCETMIRFRAYNKLLTGNVDNLLEITHRDEDLPIGFRRLFSSFSVYRTPSGRLSSSKPVNFQNWRKLGEFNMRRMVVAPPGHLLIVADFGQLEARLWAIAVEDELYLRAFVDGLDVHTINAATMHKERGESTESAYARLMAMKKAGGASKEEYDHLRLLAKVFGFSKQYGAGAQGIFNNMVKARDPVTFARTFSDLKESDVRRWDANWTKDHPRDQIWIDKVAHRVGKYGHAIEPGHGRKRYFPGGENKPDAKTNHEIQGHAAATTNGATIKIVEAIPFGVYSKWTGLCNQVHDELMVCVPEHKAEECAKVVEDCMNQKIKDVPIEAEAEIVDTWTGENLRRAA